MNVFFLQTKEGFLRITLLYLGLWLIESEPSSGSGYTVDLEGLFSLLKESCMYRLRGLYQ